MTAPAIKKRRNGSLYVPERMIKRGGLTWRPDGWPFMQSIVKPGSRGTAAISHFTIRESEARHYNIMQAMSAGTGLTRVEPGKYVRLHVGGRSALDVMMSDTPMERRTNYEIRREAHGRVLIAGLGIGLILHPLLEAERHLKGWGKYDAPLPKVEHVTVVEMNPDVIALVGPSLMRYDGRITIVQEDILTFDPGKGEKFDTVYFDIWPHISEDNLPEIAQLHQRWKTRLNRGGERPPFMSSWMADYLRSERRSNQARGW